MIYLILKNLQGVPGRNGRDGKDGLDGAPGEPDNTPKFYLQGEPGLRGLT